MHSLVFTANQTVSTGAQACSRYASTQQLRAMPRLRSATNNSSSEGPQDTAKL